MKKQLNWIMIMIMILALAGLACNAVLGNDGDAEPASGSTSVDPAPTQAVASGGSESGGGESGGETTTGSAPPTLNLNPENNFGVPSDLNSFRISLDIQFEETKSDGTTESGRITAQGAQVVEPFAMTFDFTVEGSGADIDLGGTAFSMTQIGDVSYVNLGGTGCISTSDNEFENPLTELTNSQSFLGGLQGAELVEENVSINGIQTNHYQFDDSALTQGEQAMGTLQNVEGHIYVSREEGYLVRVTMEADGQDISLGGGAGDTTGGHIVYQIDYSDFNQPIEITVPEGCDSAADSEFPLLSDATQINSFGDVLTYNTNTAFEDVITFYKTEMAAAGYSLESEFAQPPTGLLTFSRDGEEVTVSVVDNPSSDGLTIVISKG